MDLEGRFIIILKRLRVDRVQYCNTKIQRSSIMVATVRLDSELEAILNTLSKQFEKKRSEIIREAISFYAKAIENRKKNRLHQAIEKTADEDYIEYKLLEETLGDGFTK